MTFLCLWSAAWERENAASLLSIVPRVVVTGDLVWADIRGFPVIPTAERIVRHIAERQGDSPTFVSLAVASTPIAAEVAARQALPNITYIPPGEDREFLHTFPICMLRPDPRLANMLDGTGIEQCGDLARLSQESVEVRFGADGVQLWRLSRADDPRRIFAPLPPSLPDASMEWTDYTLRRAERLIFVIHALCRNVCETLQSRGMGAVVMSLRFSLANRTVHEQSVRVARPTANLSVWMRRMRLTVEQLVLADAVTGITVQVERASGISDTQGDLFDRGFTTARAVEDAIAILLDDQDASVAEPDNTQHPLLDRRTLWTSVQAGQILTETLQHAATPSLNLQLLPVPVRIDVTTQPRRDHAIPQTYRDSVGTHTIVDAAGPDRVSGEHWGDKYAREYFRCVTHDGALVWMYRDLQTETWYLHGWWD